MLPNTQNQRQADEPSWASDTWLSRAGVLTSEKEKPGPETCRSVGKIENVFPRRLLPSMGDVGTGGSADGPWMRGLRGRGVGNGWGDR